MTESFWLDSSGNLRSPLLDQFSWLRHGFGTRAAVPPDTPMASVKQVHSAQILEATEPGLLGEADALTGAVPGLGMGVKTADCVPVLLADPVRHALAAVHAGWRGTAQEIVALTVRRMRDNYGTEPGDLYAAIGPAIGACCYEVGPDVARQFAAWESRFAHADGKQRLNLESINAAQLTAAGVPPDHIGQAHACTQCNPELFFSFRKEKENAGRMISWIFKN